MEISLYIASTIGLFIVTHAEGDWAVDWHTLRDHSLTSVSVIEKVILAGSAQGIWRSVDNGRTWHESNKNLTIRHVRWLASSSKKPAVVLAGTEPAGIFVSRTGGAVWEPKPEVTALRDRHGWFLPYSPNAGCVRGFAVFDSGSKRGRMYAAVEVGGVLVSDDDGQTWQLVAGSDGKPDLEREYTEMIHADVHSIAVHPTSPDIVTAATGGGLYRSTDGGATWKSLYPCYIRAMWVDPQATEHIIAGPADGVSRNGRIEETWDGGRTWEPASGDLQAPWPKHMVERFVPAGDDLFAILSNGELLLKPLKQTRWQSVLPEITGVRAMAAGVCR